MESNISSSPPLPFIRPRSSTDDEGGLISTISTDLSRYMATESYDTRINDSTTNDTDDDTTIAESICPNSHSETNLDHQENSALDSSNKSPSPKSECKLIRSSSFTVETPSFPVSTTQQLSMSKDKFKNFDIDFINEQIDRLEAMTISLKEYHRLQLDELNAKQAEELETVEKQKAFMISVLESGKSLDQKKIEFPRDQSKFGNSKRPSSEYFQNRNLKNVSVSRPLVTRSPPQSNRSVVTATKSVASVSNVKIRHTEVPEILKAKLAALIKGHLTRRWLRTDKIKKLIDMNKDLQKQFNALKKEEPLTSVDEHFKTALAFQLRSSKLEFHQALESQSPTDRLAAIAQQRCHQTKKHHDHEDPHPFGLLSSATRKSLSRRSTSRNQSRLIVPPSPGISSAYFNAGQNRQRKNIIRISPRSKSTVFSPRKRKRIAPTSFSPSFCVARSPRRAASKSGVGSATYRAWSNQSIRRPNFGTEDDASVRSSTTMSIRMTMDTRTGNKRMEFCNFGDYGEGKKNHIENRRPWR